MGEGRFLDLRSLHVRLFLCRRPASDIERSRRFDQAVLDLEADDTVPSRLYFHCVDLILAVIDWQVEPLGPFRPTPENLYLATDDLDAAYDREQGRCRTVDADRPSALGRAVVLLRRSYGILPLRGRVDDVPRTRSCLVSTQPQRARWHPRAAKEDAPSWNHRRAHRMG